MAPDEGSQAPIPVTREPLDGLATKDKTLDSQFIKLAKEVRAMLKGTGIGFEGVPLMTAQEGAQVARLVITDAEAFERFRMQEYGPGPDIIGNEVQCDGLSISCSRNTNDGIYDIVIIGISGEKTALADSMGFGNGIIRLGRDANRAREIWRTFLVAKKAMADPFKILAAINREFRMRD